MASIWTDMYAGGGSREEGAAPSVGPLSRGGAALSPYLQFDPQTVGRMQPEFIYPDESHKAQTARRTAVALPQVGASCIIGAGNHF